MNSTVATFSEGSPVGSSSFRIVALTGKGLRMGGYLSIKESIR